MEIIELQNSAGEVKKFPAQWLTLSQRQQLIVVGCPPGEKIELGEHPDVEAQEMGLLSDLNFIMECQVRNSLENYEWEFAQYPNPNIYLLTDKRVQEVAP